MTELLTFDSIRDTKIGFGKYKTKTYGSLFEHEDGLKYIMWLFAQIMRIESNIHKVETNKRNFLRDSQEVNLLIDEFRKIHGDDALSKKSVKESDSPPVEKKMKIPKVPLDEVAKLYESAIKSALQKGCKTFEEFQKELMAIMAE